ncbi:hypothetical protein L6164_006287 [Bauhinia variegata]|uniref:Uncharacterized protein n=1 Tax=Bauhinia variegata TaxID=167791 RepID=A0ACB9PVT1_BAUVA|nr:hypothetical protein L6164_006287 [Bauhinia variegata]
MKSTLLAFLFLSALSSQLWLGAADASPEQVVDTSGKKLRAGANYYIRPVPPARCDELYDPRSPEYGRCLIGNGFVLVRIGNKTCPLDVVVVEGFRGLALTFTPVNPKKGVIRVNTDLNINFTIQTSCPSNVWKLDDFDASTGQWFVTTGGVVGNPGYETIRNWFKIIKYDDDYKLVYCPSVCENCGGLCKNVGVYVDTNGNRRLALTNDPYKVQFQAA